MIVVLNGPSSSGKTSAAESFVKVAKGLWLRFSIDDFVKSLPKKLIGEASGLTISGEGVVTTGETFKVLYEAWLASLGHLALSGVNVLYDDVLLDPTEGQQVLSRAFSGNQIIWVALECEADILSKRESARVDRPKGMAISQLSCVDSRYAADIRINSSRLTGEQIALEILNAIDTEVCFNHGERDF